MAKSKKKYPTKKNNNYQKISNSYKNGDNTTVKHNKNAYTDDYKEYKAYKETQKPLLLRLFVIALACIIFLSFVILPLVR